MTAGTDDKLLSQKMYFGDGGVYTAIIQPDPKKNDQVEILFLQSNFKWNQKFKNLHF